MMCSPDKIVAVILARSISPKRPANLLTDRALTMLRGESSLAHIVRRLRISHKLHQIILAAGHLGQDAGIIAEAKRLDLNYVAGFPDDILGRLNLGAAQTGAAHVVRINGNFPLIDPWALDELIEAHIQNNADYSTNAHLDGLVYGLGAEIMRVDVLKEMSAEARPGAVQEGTRIFLRHHLDFNIFHMPQTDHRAKGLRASLDFQGDIKKLEAIIKHCGNPDNKAVVEFLVNNPQFASTPLQRTEEVGLRKVLLFPEKLAALRCNSKYSCDLSYPVSVELSLTNRCNQDCIWCSDKNLRQRSGDAINRELLNNLFNDLAAGGTRGVTIEGGGEPSLAPFFYQSIEDAVSKGLAVGLISNGVALFNSNDDGIYENFEWIRISLDAAERQQYLRLKGIDAFDVVLKNIERLVAVAPESTIGVGYVLTNLNDDPEHLQNLVLSLRALGVSYLQVRPVVDHKNMESNCSLDFLKKFETPDFSVNLSALEDNQPRGNEALPCLAHSLSVVIAADSAVWLCGRLNTNEWNQPIGYLHNSSFYDIWNGMERKRQVALAADPVFCRSKCPQCRMTKYNRLLAELDNLKTKNFI